MRELAPVLQAGPSIQLYGFAATIAVVLGAARLVPVRPRAHPSMGSLSARSVLERIHAVIQ